jgi:hypothetical protein
MVSKLFLIIGILAITPGAFADFSYRDSTVVGKMNLYNFGDHKQSDLDRYKVVDLSANVSVGSTCGEMNIATNLQSNLKDLLSDDFFKGLGNRIQSAGGMLALCYMSPSYCAIAKHMRMSAHFLSQLNLDSCSLIDKYTDSRVQDYEMTKQQCVRQTMANNGQDVKDAMEHCASGSRNLDLTDWSGGNSVVKANDLIESTVKWAGLKGGDMSHIVDSTKAFVGDTVVARGGVDVDFGSRKKLTTPRELIFEETKAAGDKLNEVIDDLWATGRPRMTNQLSQKVDNVFGDTMSPEMARETVRKLAFMPTMKRREAVEKLSRAIASDRVVKDAEKSVEILSLAARNPNLPPARQAEAATLRQQLKDSLDMTLAMRKKESDQLSTVLSDIHEEGNAFEGDVSRRSLESDAAQKNDQRLKGLYFDCSDNVFCGGGT